jgi:hypothetical protein
MADATKCRASDDLLLAAENHPDFEDARLAFAFRSTDALIRIATGADPLPIRALAAWYAIGTDRRPSPRLSSKQGDPTAVFDALQETQIPAAVVEIALEGFRKTGEVLCPFVALLWPLRHGQTATIDDDDSPPEVMIGLSQAGPTMSIHAKAEPPSPTSSRGEHRLHVGSTITSRRASGSPSSAASFFGSRGV